MLNVPLTLLGKLRRALALLCVLASALLGARFGLAQEPADSSVRDRILAYDVHLVEDQGPDSAAVIIDLSREAPTRIEALANPPRLTIDLEGAALAGTGARSGQRVVGPISGFRAGLFLGGQTRIVLDLARPTLIERMDVVRQGRIVRLVVQVRAVSAERFAQQAAADAALRRKRAAVRAPVSGPRKADSRPLIVLDPGHGGIDPGASGAKGEAEKDIVLAIALAVRDALRAGGRVAVEMTRDDDRFVPLRDRVDFARERSAALLVSLHADTLAGESDVRGASVYTLAERATDDAAARAAEKENRADLAAGIDAGDDVRSGVESVLMDLARRETRSFSQLAARDAVAALRDGFRLHKTPVRGAGFRVLRAPDMPSILIELGYLSNAEDLAALVDPAQQKRMGGMLARALERFALATHARPSP